MQHRGTSDRCGLGWKLQSASSGGQAAAGCRGDARQAGSLTLLPGSLLSFTFCPSLQPVQTTATTSHSILCGFVFQVFFFFFFFFAADMCSLATAASQLLLLCYTTGMLVAPPCSGQGKVT